MADPAEAPKALTPGQRADKFEEIARVASAAQATAEALAKAQTERANALQAQLDEINETVVKPVLAIGMPAVGNLKRFEDKLKEGSMSDHPDPHAKSAGPKKAGGDGAGKKIENFFATKSARFWIIVVIGGAVLWWIFFGYHPPVEPPPYPPTISSSEAPPSSEEPPTISSEEPSSEASSEEPPSISSSEEPPIIPPVTSVAGEPDSPANRTIEMSEMCPTISDEVRSVMAEDYSFAYYKMYLPLSCDGYKTALVDVPHIIIVPPEDPPADEPGDCPEGTRPFLDEVTNIMLCRDY